MGLELGGGAQSFPFEYPGDSVEGEITSVTEMQGTDMDSGQPLWWDSAQTRPKMVVGVTLQTTLRDDADDDGRRVVYLGGNRFTAVRKVTKRVDEGAYFKLTFVGLSDREPAKRGFAKAKLFTAEYRPASTSGGVSLDRPGAPSATPAAGGQQPLSEEQKQTLRALGVNV